MNNYYPMYYNNDDRLIGGGFLGPFILGGLAGGLFNRPNNYYPVYPYPPRPYPPRPYPPRPYPPRPYPPRP